jgi:CheY-like chemotaxis protein
MARILVVDDRAENRDLLAYLLSYFGHEVVTASNGVDAVGVALAQFPDLVVMDIAMPGMDGFTAASLMRSEEALSATPLVAVSATGAVNSEMAHVAGFDAFYPLPIDPRHFLTQLEPFLSRPRVAEDAVQGEP